MARFIAHRGNLWGPKPEYENTMDYLLYAYDICGAVEVDVQWHNDQLYLGHDEPQQPVPEWWLTYPNWFWHAKDLNSLMHCMDQSAHTFWHQTDTVTITSQGYVWCYPGHYPKHPKSIWLDLLGAQLPQDISKCWGVCGDYINHVYPRDIN